MTAKGSGETMELRKNLDTEENREFWAAAERASATVATWPEWKRKLKVTKFSRGDGNGTAEKTE